MSDASNTAQASDTYTENQRYLVSVSGSAAGFIFAGTMKKTMFAGLTGFSMQNVTNVLWYSKSDVHKGIGRLASHGPIPGDRFADYPDMQFIPDHRIVFVIPIAEVVDL